MQYNDTVYANIQAGNRQRLAMENRVCSERMSSREIVMENLLRAVIMCLYLSLLCTTARRTGLYQLRYTAPNVAPDDGLKSPKHIEHIMINKDTL